MACIWCYFVHSHSQRGTRIQRIQEHCLCCIFFNFITKETHWKKEKELNTTQIYNNAALLLVAIPLAVVMEEIPSGTVIIEVAVIVIAFTFTMSSLFFDIWMSIPLVKQNEEKTKIRDNEVWLEHRDFLPKQRSRIEDVSSELRNDEHEPWFTLLWLSFLSLFSLSLSHPLSLPLPLQGIEQCLMFESVQNGTNEWTCNLCIILSSLIVAPLPTSGFPFDVHCYILWK